MIEGFVRVAAATPEIQVADPAANSEEIIRQIRQMEQKGASVMVFPELCITGYTCGDLFLQSALLTGARKALADIIDAAKQVDALIFVGLPWEHKGKLYNVAAAVCKGRLLGLVPKSHIPNYSEFYEARHFAAGPKEAVEVSFTCGEESWQVPMGTKLLFSCKGVSGFTVAAEICEDLWVPAPPSTEHAMAGASVIVNLSASDETTGKSAYRRSLVEGQSGRLVCGYVYSSAGEGESTTDLVFAGHNLIAENGAILSESVRFENGIIYGELDLERLKNERRRMGTFTCQEEEGYRLMEFELKSPWAGGEMSRFVDPMPFVPSGASVRSKRCEEILNIQTMGLKKRLKHTGCQCAVVGISGGLDSTLALLVTARAFDSLGLERKQILAVTMPCFGTTDRTYNNACRLTRMLGATLMEVPIKDAVTVHFKDIGQPLDRLDVTFENGQARERTQVLMDLANQRNGMVIGTGDMSELALGWATYNGDHMSMYGVNASVPKTLVRHLVRYYGDTCGDETLKAVLDDVLDTPVSPELLPPKDGEIAQKTEDIVGPYELHDFYLYYILRFGFSPARIYELAKKAFSGRYEEEVILKWLKIFYRRFFSQQFKRSCLPDGPKVGSVAVSPRGDLRMPSDASSRLWLDELELL